MKTKLQYLQNKKMRQNKYNDDIENEYEPLIFEKYETELESEIEFNKSLCESYICPIGKECKCSCCAIGCQGCHCWNIIPFIKSEDEFSDCSEEFEDYEVKPNKPRNVPPRNVPKHKSFKLIKPKLDKKRAKKCIDKCIDKNRQYKYECDMPFDYPDNGCEVCCDRSKCNFTVSRYE